MRKIIVLISCVFSPILVHSQTINGVLVSLNDSSAVENAHIINLSQDKMTTTDSQGKFTIPAIPGDTVYISNINFKSRQFIIKDKLDLRITVAPIKIELKEILVSNLPLDENDFKKKLKDMPFINQNESLPFGVTPGKPMEPVPKMYERETKLIYSGGIGLPISFFTKKFSKRHKAERDYYEAKAAMGTTIDNSKKFNRELVAKFTNLEGESLTDFINYLDLEPHFIKTSSEYEIINRIISGYEEYKMFLEDKKLEKED